MLKHLSPESMPQESLLAAALLETGDTLNFLEARKHALRKEIKDSKLSAGTAKISGIAGAIGGMGLLTLANPLGWLVVGGGVSAYLMGVAAQWMQSGKLHLLPLSTKSVGEMADNLSNSTVSGQSMVSEKNAAYARTQIREDAAYLDSREKVEYELLNLNPGGLMSAMNHVHPTQRWACYNFLIDAFVSGMAQEYMNPDNIKAVLGNPANYRSHLPAATTQFPELELGHAVENVTHPQLQQDSTPPPGLPKSEIPTQQGSQPMGHEHLAYDVSLDLGSNPQSALIAGVPGSGKGMVVSNAIRHLKSKHPALTVMMIDPKGDDKEAGYWASVADLVRGFKLMSCSDPDEGAAWLLQSLDEFNRLPAPKLLVLDELLAVATELSLADKSLKAPQRLKKLLSGWVAQGDSQDVWVWTMTQSVNAADLGFSAGVRGNLRAIGIISPKNINAIEGLTSTRLIPPPPGGMAELRELMSASPVDRAFFDSKSGRWYSMPRLQNHSGYDRDARSFAPGYKPTATPKVEPQDEPQEVIEPDDDMPELELKEPDEAALQREKKDVFELSQAILELLEKNPDKSYGEDSLRTHRFIKEKLDGKTPSSSLLRECLRKVSRLSFVVTDDEGKVQWKNPTNPAD